MAFSHNQSIGTVKIQYQSDICFLNRLRHPLVQCCCNVVFSWDLSQENINTNHAAPLWLSHWHPKFLLPLYFYVNNNCNIIKPQDGDAGLLKRLGYQEHHFRCLSASYLQSRAPPRQAHIPTILDTVTLCQNSCSNIRTTTMKKLHG